MSAGLAPLLTDRAPPRAAPTPRGRAAASADQRERRTRAAPRGTSAYHRAGGCAGPPCAAERLLEGTPGPRRPRGAAAPQIRAELRPGAGSRASPPSPRARSPAAVDSRPGRRAGVRRER